MSPWSSFLPVLQGNLLHLPALPAIDPTAVVERFPAFVDSSLKAVLKDPNHLAALGALYRSADPLNSALAFAAVNSVLVWLLGEITGNVSQVDREWSFLPFLYTLHFTLHPLLASSAPLPKELSDVPAYLLAHTSHVQLLVLGTQLLWCLRLTFNGARRGFFWPTTEDYRWIVLREHWPKGVFGWLAWRVFNAVFIAVIQNLLLLAIALPSYYLLLQAPRSIGSTTTSAYFSRKELGTFEAASQAPSLGHWLLAGAAASCIVVQYMADGQQQAYQSWKHTSAAKREPTATWSFLGGLGGKLRFDRADLDRGFISTGLWSFSRHPAFALEQIFWWLQACFPIVPLAPQLRAAAPHVSSAVKQAGRQLVSVQHKPSLSVKPGDWRPLAHVAAQLVRELPLHVFVGAAGLTALFIGSTLLTEGITSPKYPLYSSAYQRRVGMFLPIQSYWKRVYTSVVYGNEWRREREAELGWRQDQPRFKTE